MDRRYAFGPYTLDPDRRVLARRGEPVPLTARAFDVLLALVERAGVTVEKDALLQLVWPDTVVEEANLSQQIFTIRRLLGQTDETPYIATVPRRGYRFVAAVEQPRARPTLEPQAAAAPGPRIHRLAIALEPAAVPGSAASRVLAIAGDGRRIAYVALRNGVSHLYLRSMDAFEAALIPGTDGASDPAFSPDGEWLAFHRQRSLQKVWIGGGPPVALCAAPDSRGITWTRSGLIVFAPGPTAGLWQVPEGGGPAAPVTTLDYEGGERTHRWPHAVPDDSGVVFTVGRAGATSFDEASLACAALPGGGHRLLLQHATDGRVIPGGRLAWARGGCLMAAPVDLASMTLTGPARVVQRGVAVSATGVAHIACDAGATCVHVPGEPETLQRSLVIVNRAGALERCVGSGQALEEPRSSPDGRLAIVSLRNRSSDLWLCDLARGGLTRVTFEGENFAGIWGPGAAMLTYSSSRGGSPSDLYIVAADRSTPEALLVASEFDKAAGGWTPDGGFLVFTEYHPETGADIWVLDRAGECARALVRTRFNEYGPAVSPDGRFVAYTTDESGRPEVHLVPIRNGSGRRQVSTDGGSEPAWSRDGRELFYRSGDRLMRTDMSRGPEDPGIPTTLFEGRFVAGSVTLANYDVSADGRGFLMVQTRAAVPATHVCVTLGWPGPD